VAVAKCDVCSNDYENSFTVTLARRTRTFDSFACAIHALVPSCAHCGRRVVGHGVEPGGTVYRCAHRAKQAGIRGVADRA
jgi:hypothetical protein